MTIYIQSVSPGVDKEANWLPSPTSGMYYMILRAHIPDIETIEAHWTPPPVWKPSKDTEHCVSGHGPDLAQQKAATWD